MKSGFEADAWLAGFIIGYALAALILGSFFYAMVTSRCNFTYQKGDYAKTEKPLE